MNEQQNQQQQQQLSLLFRLFNSELFDYKLAVVYLFKYADSVGIQHYICELLKTQINTNKLDLNNLTALLLHLHQNIKHNTAIEELIIWICSINEHFAIEVYILLIKGC